MEMITTEFIYSLLYYTPFAYADIKGSSTYPNINGRVMFIRTGKGTIVNAEVVNLPDIKGKCGGGFFGFHIHEGKKCTGNSEDPFADTLSHFDPNGCEHPYHAGDFPSLLSNNGVSWMTFFSDRIVPNEIIGRTVVIHKMPDDFHTQPSGNSGEKIACGVIYKV